MKVEEIRTPAVRAKVFKTDDDRALCCYTIQYSVFGLEAIIYGRIVRLLGHDRMYLREKDLREQGYERARDWMISSFGEELGTMMFEEILKDFERIRYKQ
jgi:hypothetical protein